MSSLAPTIDPVSTDAAKRIGPNVARVVVFFETLTPASVGQLPGLYDSGARFVDPFNDVQGLPAVKAIFQHMFDALHEPRFVVTGQVVQGSQCFLLWDFHFRFKRFDRHTVQTIRGTSHLVFSEAGLVVLHRDYWDAAQELYEKLPLIGGVMRWLKKRWAENQVPCGAPTTRVSSQKCCGNRCNGTGLWVARHRWPLGPLPAGS